MTQLITVFVIVAVVAFFTARKITRRLKGKDSACSCGCNNCPTRQADSNLKCHQADDKK
ncbi:MAG: FeoB-associated Cys-rich membrane protein [Bacteroidales bacterium]|nr:FeoB-associated Cys-rich membrane protein [Bacteroidales bacterium]